MSNGGATGGHPPSWTPERAAAAPYSLAWCHALQRELVGVGTGAALHPALHAAYRLLRHARNAAVARRVGEGYLLVATGERLSGLTQPLREVFYPYHRVASTGGARTGGSARGTRVDREVAALINRGVIPASGALHPYADRMLRFLHRHRLQPCAAQFIIYDTRLGIATEVDLVCVDLDAPASASRSNVVLVECKTGFDRNYEAVMGRFCSPFVERTMLTQISMTHRNAHQLQALAQFVIARVNYGPLVQRAAVLVLSEGENALYAISAELMAVRYDVYRNLEMRASHSPEDVQRRGAAAAAREARARALFT